MTMKKIIFTFVMILMPIMPLMAGIKAYYTYVDGLYYDFNSNGTASVTGEFRYTDGSNEYSTNNYSGDVVIPATVTYKNRTYSVTRIHNWAFWGCTNLNSVTIPRSIKSIGSEAFYRCHPTSIYISDIAAWCNIKSENSCLYYSHLFLNGEEVHDLVIPNGVTSIGNETFSGCDLTSVSIPDGVTYIGDYAFNTCSNLNSVTIPNSVEFIGLFAFAGTAWYNNLPDGLIYAGKVVLRYRGEMPANTHISIKDGTIGITATAFSGCSGLTSITIPQSVKTIGCDAFSGCSSLASIEIPKSVTSIEDRTFYNCSSLTSVTIPQNVTSIGRLAFRGCSGLTTIISEIEYPFEVKSNYVFAFSGDDGIDINATLIVPKGKKSVYQTTDGWKEFPNIVEIGEGGIVDQVIIINGIYFKIKSKNTVSVVSGNKKYSVNVVIPESVDYNGKTYSVISIGNIAFYDYSDLTSITIPNSVTSIGSSAFYGCSSLTSITIPNSVTSIGSFAFYGTGWFNNQPDGFLYLDNCLLGYKNKLGESRVINEGTRMIANSAFQFCGSLDYIIIPKSVTKVGSRVFDGCSGLNYICLASDDFPSFETIDNTICQYIMPQKAFESGIPQEITNYATYSDKPMYIRVKSKTATSAVLELRPVDTTNGGLKGNTYSVKLQGLAPAASIKGVWKVDPFGYGKVRLPNDKTMSLTMSVQAAKAVSTTKARLSATVNEANDDKRYGFEWLRYDAPDNMTPNRVSAPLYDGQIIGTLSNLNPDIYYKYRPFYKADDGTIIRGEWEAFITGDANVFFEPEVHTNEPAALTKDGAQLSGVWVEGTEDIQEKGFEYWPKNSGARPATRGDHVTAIIVKGNETSVTLEGLEAGTEYIYRSYMRTASGTVYGEEVTFKTPLMGDANNDGKVNVADIVEVVNAKAGNPSASFNMTNADTDGNGSLTEADITAIANIIVTKK
jgi:hypothetical protein